MIYVPKLDGTNYNLYEISFPFKRPIIEWEFFVIPRIRKMKLGILCVPL